MTLKQSKIDRNLEIFLLHAAGVRSTEIARRFGIARSRVGQILQIAESRLKGLPLNPRGGRQPHWSDALSARRGSR